MLGLLKAFAWMRWRVLVNSFERTGSRDTTERLSFAVDQIGPFVVAVLLVPSMLAIFALGAYAGYALATGLARPVVFEILRYLALGSTVLAVAGPILLPGTDRTNAVRLLLLPIPRRTLYAAQAAGSLSDLWLMLMLPVFVSMPLGLAAGGAVGAAGLALTAGVLLALVILGLSTLTTNAVHLLVRNRRRGELVVLLFIVLLPVMSLLPAVVDGRQSEDIGDAGQPSRRDRLLPEWADAASQRAFALLPSERFVAATRHGVEQDPLASGASLATLAATATVLHVLGLVAFGRLLDAPSTTGSRRVTREILWAGTLPGLSSGASAVAMAQIRLAIRTPRGRSIILSPLVVVVMFAMMTSRAGRGMDVGPWNLQSGLALATFGASVCLLAILPLAMNQFAVDRAGLTLALLLPLRDSEWLAGKAVGNAVIAGAPALVCMLLAFLVFRDGTAALWASLPLGLASTYLLAAPVAAVASAMLPRAVDLNSIGRRSNAHGAAGFIGLVTFAVSALPAVALILAATRLFERPILAPAFLLVWCVMAFGFSRLLFVPVTRLVAARRENLGLVVR